jgi:hypothetical protein
VSPLRYCGNCNPDGDPVRVTERLLRVFGEDSSGGVIRVNGCMRACLSETAADLQDPGRPLVLSASEIMRWKA